MSKNLKNFIKKIEHFTKWQGYIFCWLIFPLVFVLVYEVISRFIFGSPTIWAYDLTYLLFGSFCFLGGAYTLLTEGHLRVDVIYNKFSPKNKNIIEAINYVIFFFPVMIVCLYFGSTAFWRSWIMREQGSYGIWSPVIYPYRAVIPISMLFLSFQGIANFIRCILFIFKKEGEKI